MRHKPSPADTFVWIAAVAATTAWIVFIVIYLSTIGMNGVLAFTPTEVALLLLAAAGPPAVLWLLVGYGLQRRELNILARALTDLSGHSEAQARALLEAHTENKKQSFISTRSLALQDLNAQAALIAERLSLLNRDQADTLWARTGAGDIWAFYSIFLMAQAADGDFPSRLGEAASGDDISYAAMTAFVRRYTQLSEAQQGFELDRLGRDIVDDGPLARVASIFKAAELAADAVHTNTEYTPEPYDMPEHDLEDSESDDKAGDEEDRDDPGQIDMFTGDDPENEKERLGKIIDKLEKVSAAAKEAQSPQS